MIAVVRKVFYFECPYCSHGYVLKNEDYFKTGDQNFKCGKCDAEYKISDKIH